MLCNVPADFYPRPPRGGRHTRRPRSNPRCGISIHALREEGDCTKLVEPLDHPEFLSTPSARRATICLGDSAGHIRHFYPRPPRGGRPDLPQIPSGRPGISIHALREEGDRSRPWCGSGRSYFYPRPPRGGRLYELLCIYIDVMISIHALREEGDVEPLTAGVMPLLFLSTPSARRVTDALAAKLAALEFLSTPSARRVTRLRQPERHEQVISIHALREEGDWS